MVRPSSRRKLAAVGFATLCLAGMVGCYEVKTRGDASIYGFAAWVKAAVIVAGVAAVPVGWKIRKQVPRWGFTLLILGPLVLIFIAPAMFRDEVRVAPDEFEASYGFWFSPTRVKVRFDELSQIRIVGTRGNRGRISYSMHCLGKNGTETVVPLGDLIKNAVEEIGERAHQHNIALSVDEP